MAKTYKKGKDSSSLKSSKWPQVLVGVLFLIIGGMNINDPQQQKAANILNNIIVVFLFVISVVNVILNSIGIEQMNILPPGVPIKTNSTKT